MRRMAKSKPQREVADVVPRVEVSWRLPPGVRQAVLSESMRRGGHPSRLINELFARHLSEFLGLRR